MFRVNYPKGRPGQASPPGDPPWVATRETGLGLEIDMINVFQMGAVTLPPSAARWRFAFDSASLKGVHHA